MTQEAERDVFEGFKVSCAAPPPPYLPAAAPPLALDPQHSSGDEWLGTRSRHQSWQIKGKTAAFAYSASACQRPLFVSHSHSGATSPARLTAVGGA